MNKKMEFLINNEITFRSDDGVLTSLSAPEHTVTLSITANRILTYLLEQEGKVVSRDDMFVNVWDKHGLQASNNSLSQYISLIRKNLQELGCDQEIIQTVPRVGFFIAEGVISVVENETPPLLPAPEHATPPSHRLPAWVKRIAIAAVVLSLILLFYPLNAILNDPVQNIPTAKTFKLGNIDQCPVYTLYESSPQVAPVKLEQAKKLATQELECMAGAEFLFQPDDLYVYGEKGRVFLSRCTFSNAEKTKFAGCKDLYIHEYKK